MASSVQPASFALIGSWCSKTVTHSLAMSKQHKVARSVLNSLSGWQCLKIIKWLAVSKPLNVWLAVPTRQALPSQEKQNACRKLAARLPQACCKHFANRSKNRTLPLPHRSNLIFGVLAATLQLRQYLTATLQLDNGPLICIH